MYQCTFLNSYIVNLVVHEWLFVVAHTNYLSLPDTDEHMWASAHQCNSKHRTSVFSGYILAAHVCTDIIHNEHTHHHVAFVLFTLQACAVFHTLTVLTINHPVRKVWQRKKHTPTQSARNQSATLSCWAVLFLTRLVVTTDSAIRSLCVVAIRVRRAYWKSAGRRCYPVTNNRMHPF